ncbi:MAG: peptidoglycan DD-metalloendopeptidase family protein [candidate division WOR-3 bacterium]
MNQSSGSEVNKYPVFIINYLKDIKSTARGWVDFFKGYLSNAERRLDYTVNDPRGVLNSVAGYFEESVKSLRDLFYRIVGLNSYVQQVSSETARSTFISDKLLYGYNITTRDIYENIDNYVDKKYFVSNQGISSDGSFVTDRGVIEDPLNHIYSTILGDNIYQTYVFTVKPYTTYNVNAILDSNLIRMWETDFEYTNCQWRVNKSSAVIGLHPAFHEDFINTFHILPKIYDIVVNNLKESRRVLSPKKFRREKLFQKPFILSDKAFEFIAATYVFKNRNAAASYLRGVETIDADGNKIKLVDFIKKYKNGIKKIYILGHGSLEIPPKTDSSGRKRSEKDRIAEFLTNYALTYSVSNKRAHVIYNYLLGNLSDDEMPSSPWLGKKWRGERKRPYSLIPTAPAYEKYTDRIRQFYDTFYNNLEVELKKPNPNLESIYNKFKMGKYADPWGDVVVLDWTFSGGNFLNMKNELGANVIESLRQKVEIVSGFGWMHPVPIEYSDLYFKTIVDSVPAGDTERPIFYDLNKFDIGQIETVEDVIADFDDWETILKGNGFNFSKGSGSPKNVFLKSADTRNRNRRIEVYFDMDEPEEIVRLVEDEKAIEGYCIELGDRTPYDKLKEQVFGVPTETSKYVTGLNFHRPRFIVLLPPLYLGNDSPFTFALRSFKLDQNEYRSLLNSLDTIVKNIQYKIIETPMGDVVMEPLNYDSSPWHQNLAALRKVEWGTYLRFQEHVVHEGAFAKVYKDVPHINVFPTYLSSFYKPSDEVVKNKFSVSLPVVRIPDNARDPYNFNSMNLYSSDLRFDSNNVYTRIRVVGTQESTDPMKSAIIQNYMDSQLQTLLTIGAISANSGLNNSLINRNNLIPYGEYIADGFEDLVRNLEIEVVSAKTSMLINTAANVLTNALLEDEVKLNKKNFVNTLRNWFSDPGDLIYYPYTLGEIIEKYCIPFLKPYADKLKIKLPNKINDDVFRVIGTVPNLAMVLEYYPRMDVESSGSKANNRFIIYYQVLDSATVKRRDVLKRDFIRTLSQDELVQYPGETEVDKNNAFVNKVISRWDDGARKVIFHVFMFLLENSDLGKKLIASTSEFVNQVLEKRLNTINTSGNNQNQGNQSNMQISSFVRERLNMTRPVFTYSDLSKLRRLGVYNPQSDFVTLYGYNEYPPIVIPYLHSDLDCSVYAMAIFNQLFNELYTYSLNALPLTPEILINRTGYFSENNTINLIKDITHTYTVNSNSETSIDTSYIRRNIYYRPEGVITPPSLNENYLGSFIKSYSIMDIPVNQNVNNYDLIVKSFNESDENLAGVTYSSYRKLGYLFESLTERQHQLLESQDTFDKLKDKTDTTTTLDSKLASIRRETLFRIDWTYTKYEELTEMLDTFMANFYVNYDGYKRSFEFFRDSEAKYIALSNDEGQYQNFRKVLVQDLEEAKNLKLSIEQKISDITSLIAQQDSYIQQIDTEIQDKVSTLGTSFYDTSGYLQLSKDKTGFLVYKTKLEQDLLQLQVELSGAEVLVSSREQNLKNLEESRNQQVSSLDPDNSSVKSSLESLANSISETARQLNLVYEWMIGNYNNFISYYALVYGSISNSKTIPPVVYRSAASGKGTNQDKIEVYLFSDDVYVFETYKNRYRHIEYKNNDLTSLRGFYSQWESLIPGNRTYKENKFVTGIEKISTLPDTVKKKFDVDFKDVIRDDILDVTEDKPLLVSLYLNRKKLEDIDNGLYQASEDKSGINNSNTNANDGKSKVTSPESDSNPVVTVDVIKIFWPIKPKTPPGIYVVSGYGPRSPIHGETKSFHAGTDYRSSDGNHLVYAVEDGIITNIRPVDPENPSLTEFNPNTNQYEVIPERRGKVKNPFITLVGKYSKNKYVYIHVSSDVKVGQSVTAGQLIGKAGNYGVSFGPHLHFELWPFDYSTNTLADFSVDAHEYFINVFGMNPKVVSGKEFKPEEFFKIVRQYKPIKRR